MRPSTNSTKGEKDTRCACEAWVYFLFFSLSADESTAVTVRQTWDWASASMTRISNNASACGCHTPLTPRSAINHPSYNRWRAGGQRMPSHSAGIPRRGQLYRIAKASQNSAVNKSNCWRAMGSTVNQFETFPPTALPIACYFLASSGSRAASSLLWWSSFGS